MAALDSQQKRMAAAGIARPWMRAVFPVATPTEAWRISVGLAYPNALSPPVGGIGIPIAMYHYMHNIGSNV